MTRAARVLIIGAGHNGLVCGACLARAGYSVELLEARDRVGGAAAEREFADGFKSPGLAHFMHAFHPRVLRELGLEGLGQGDSLHTIALDRDGRHLAFEAGSVSGEGLSQADMDAYAKFKMEFGAYARSLSPLYMNRPPRLKNMDFRDKTTLAKTGWSLRFGLGKRSMREFLRVGGANIYDVLNEWFENECLKGAIACDAVMGVHMGPRTPGTVLTYLNRIFGEAEGAGSYLNAGAIANALENAATGAGATIRTNAKVKEIAIADGKATGVTLASGETVSADIVVSNLDAKSTFLNLTGAPNLDAMFVHRVSKQRTDGDVAKLHLALSGLPEFSGLTRDRLRHRFLIAPEMRYVEHAFNHSKYGEYSERPVLEFTVPTISDSSLAPDGHHVLSVNASFAPYQLKGGWECGRDGFAERVIDVIESYAPGLRSLILHRELLTPEDIETEYGNAGGHWHHGDMGIDQSFMMRPVHGAAQYATPVEGLFLCGAAAHPGGGVTGLPGRNAAQQILAMEGRK